MSEITVTSATRIQRQNLYVMQNEHGLIKVGRSLSASTRRRRLEVDYRCKIALIIEFPGHGPREERLINKLAPYRVGPELRSEWFDGSNPCRALLAQVLRTRLTWPYALDLVGAKRWLEDFEDRQWDNYVQGCRRRMLGNLKAASLGLSPFQAYHRGHPELDARLWSVLDGVRPTMTSDEGLLRGIDFDDETDEPIYLEIPPYTTDLSAALTLWSDPRDAAAWLEYAGSDANALACCIEALGFEWGIDVQRLKPRAGW